MNFAEAKLDKPKIFLLTALTKFTDIFMVEMNLTAWALILTQ